MPDASRCPKLSCGLITLAVLSVVILLLTIVSYPVVEHIIHQQVKQKVQLKNGSDTYEMWEEPSVPIYMQIYVFDLQNAEAVLENNTKPSVVERGPYTYLEHRKKIDIVHHHNGTVTYRQIKTYTFVHSMSIGPDSDEFTTANLPLITLANAARWHGPGYDILTMLAKHIDGGVFITRSVRDIAFGYHDAMLEIGTILKPDQFYTSLVGILAGKNATDDGVYTVYTGEEDLGQLGMINKYNGTSLLKFWTSNAANMINGTDGSLAPPFLTKKTRLYMFASDICRSVYGEYSGDLMSPHGVPLYRYSGTAAVLSSGRDNPDNAGFCTPKGNCMGAGVVNLTTCQTLDSYPVPMIASYPHFCWADKEYIDAIDGMHPDPRYHSTEVDIEPTTGIVMQASKKLQLNIYIENITDIDFLANMQTMVYPILWLNESFVLDEAHEQQVLREVIKPLGAVHITQFAGFAIGGCLLIIFLTCLVVKIRKQGERVNDEEETDSLIT